jgi:GxxExxY protein
LFWKPARIAPHVEHLINDILDAALVVHSCLGCGFVESIYRRALATELRKRDLRIEREKLIKIWYGSQIVGKHCLDLVVDETVILELKAARAIIPVHAAQMKSYLQATGYPTGLILNFGMPELQWEVLQRDLSVLSEPSPNKG